MGNANGREEAEDGGEDRIGRSGGDSGFPADFPASSNHRACAASVDSVGNTPPESPRMSRSPLLFPPQLPVAPLQRAAEDPPVLNQIWMSDTGTPSDLPHEKGIPTLISWNYGGNDVLVEGSWDNWTSRKILQRTGKDHSILLVLPSGIYQYRFIVDGEWRYICGLPCISDEMGRMNNLLDVNDYVPEILESVAEFEPPLSPDSSYGQPFPVEEDLAKDPPLVPPHLHLTVLGTQNIDETPIKPQHVVLNHLFIEKGWASESIVALGLTHRFQSKYVTVVLYKPLRR